jgi:hypothetical protein
MAPPTLLDGIDLIVPHQADKTMAIQPASAAGITPGPSLMINHQQLTERGRQIGPGHDREDDPAVRSGTPWHRQRLDPGKRVTVRPLPRSVQVPAHPPQSAEEDRPGGRYIASSNSSAEEIAPVTQRLHGGEGRHHRTLPDAALTWASRCADYGVCGVERAPAPLSPKAPQAGFEFVLDDSRARREVDPYDQNAPTSRSSGGDRRRRRPHRPASLRTVSPRLQCGCVRDALRSPGRPGGGPHPPRQPFGISCNTSGPLPAQIPSRLDPASGES